LAQVLDELHRGELDPKVASSMAAVATAFVRVLQAGELEERVKELEVLAKTQDDKQGGRGYGWTA
jgi:hypothetical protein